MARSTRSGRRVPMRYSEDEYVLQSQPKKTRKTNGNNDATSQTKEIKKDSQVPNVKGNLRESDVTISIFGSPVLRDRTNLAKPTLKSDVLKKKGTSEEPNGKKTTKKATDDEKIEAMNKKMKNIDIENFPARTRTRRAPIGKKEDIKNLSPKKSKRISDAGKIAATKKVNDSRALVVEKEDDKNALRRKSQRRSLETGKKEEVVEKKKFFKKKSPGALIMENMEPAKKALSGKRKIVARDKPRFSSSFKLRQTTLQESFMKQNAKKNLRPRRATKNYCEESATEKSKIANTEDKDTEKKLPIYKTSKLTESRENNPSEIYEFEYNSNDSLERMVKKRKKKRLGVRVIAKKSQKNTKKLTSVAKATVKNLVTKIGEAKNENKINEVKNENKINEAKNRNKINEANNENKINEVKNNEKNIDVPLNLGNEDNFSPMECNEEPQEIKVTTRQAIKPIVVECLELKGDARINSTALRKSNELRKNDSQGLRATSAFVVEPSGQYNKMSNHVLLNKSLSPISKAIDSFDPGSPWRAPTFPIHQFSRVKGIVQSTPQISSPRPQEPIRILGDSGKTISTLRTMIGKKIEKNSDNSSPQLVDKPTPKKSVKITKSPRKFGTEISNAPTRFGPKTINESPEKKETNMFDENVIKVVKSPRKFGTEISNVKNSNVVTKTIIESPKKISDENIKAAKSPRKFGTEISNVNNSNFVTKAIIESPKETSDENVKVDKSPRKFGTEISNVKKSTFVTKAIIESPPEIKSKSDENVTKTIKSLRKFGTEISNTNVPNFDSIDVIETSDSFDKENSAPLDSPQKNVTSFESPKRQPNVYRSPTKLSTKTNQAGPSGLQKRSPLKECRLLKQSNLNNFLNLENVPTSTRITTIHGIFDDANSEPINGKAINARVTKEANVENAFGFDDDEEETIEEPIVSSSTVKFANPKIRKRIVAKGFNNNNEATSSALTARLSVGQIKKHLQLPTMGKSKIVNDRKEKIEHEENMERLDSAEQVVPPREKIVNFSDTFDLSIEPDQSNHTENLLFADLEPVHFKQPPRHLYKRKRIAARIAYSDDEDEDRNIDAHDDEHINHGTKRRKITKIEKQRQKKLEEWAKDVNETFEQIDNFDLIVE